MLREIGKQPRMETDCGGTCIWNRVAVHSFVGTQQSSVEVQPMTTTKLPSLMMHNLEITDMADHLPLIQKMLQANSHLLEEDIHQQERTHAHLFSILREAFIRREQ